MSTTTFEFQFTKTVQVKVDDDLQDILTDEWRDTLFPIYTLEGLARHIAWNKGIMRFSDVEGLLPEEHEKFEIVWAQWE